MQVEATQADRSPVAPHAGCALQAQRLLAGVLGWPAHSHLQMIQGRRRRVQTPLQPQPATPHSSLHFLSFFLQYLLHSHEQAPALQGGEVLRGNGGVPPSSVACPAAEPAQ